MHTESEGHSHQEPIPCRQKVMASFLCCPDELLTCTRVLPLAPPGAILTLAVPKLSRRRLTHVLTVTLEQVLCMQTRSQEGMHRSSLQGKLTGSDDLCEALAGGEEDEELAKVGEQAEVQEEQQKEVEERVDTELKACTPADTLCCSSPSQHITCSACGNVISCSVPEGTLCCIEVESSCMLTHHGGSTGNILWKGCSTSLHLPANWQNMTKHQSPTK